MKRLLALLVSLLFFVTAAHAAVVVTEPVAEINDTASNGTSYNFTAFTPAANSVLIAHVMASDTLAAGAMSGGGLTWTKVGSTVRGGTDTHYIFRATVGASPASTTANFSCSGDAASGVIAALFQITGANTSNPVRQSKFGTSTTGTDPSITLDAAAVTTSAVLVSAMLNRQTPGVTMPAGYTSVLGTTGVGHGQPNKSAAAAYRATGETGSTITFSASSSVHTVVAVEIATMTTGGGAGVQEICGNGYDDDGVDGDASCGTPDSDRDGYVDSEDCEPNDRTIYPGIRVACGTDGTKLCNVTGSYSACAEGELCEATGSGECFYVNPTTGSDSNTCKCRVAAGACTGPCATLAPFSKGASKEIGAGDVLYLMSGTIDSAVNTSCSGQRAALCFNGMNGTSANRITVKGYPGQTPTIDISACVNQATKCVGAIYAFNSDYLTIGPNITFRDFFGAAFKGSDGTAEVRLTGLTVRDLDGDTDPAGAGDNVHGFYLQSMVNTEIDHNFVFDIYDRLRPSDKNATGISFYQGTGNRLHHNVLYTTFAENTGPGCWRYKHADRGTANGGVVDPAGSGDVEVDNNIFWNCSGAGFGMGGGQPNMHIHHNLIVNSLAHRFADFGGANYAKGFLFEYNTMVGSRGIEIDPKDTYDGVIGTFQFSRNIVQDDSASYPGDQSPIIVGRYVTNAQYTDMTPDLTLQNNCYRNSNGVTWAWDIGGSGESSGAVYASLAAVAAALPGKEAGSVMMDTNLSTETFDPLDADCVDMGHYASWVSETGSTQSGGGSTTTSSTTTTTSSTTTAATTTTLGSDSSGTGAGKKSPKHWGKGRQ